MPPKLLHIVIDGCRPDGLAQADTPHLDALWRTGAYSWRAQSIMPSISLPCHTSMFRGVLPDKHGITKNVYNPAADAFPSIIDMAYKKGLHTAMFTSWGELRDLAAPPNLNMCWLRNPVYGEENDSHTVRAAIEYLWTQLPDYCFLYLGDVDISGHGWGWMSPEYIRAIEINDQLVGQVIAALENAGIRDKYAFLVQSDHGGHDTDHGTDSAEDMTTIWFMQGQGIKRGHELEADFDLRATPPTIAHLLNIDRPPEWDSAPVYDAFQ